MDVTIVVGIHDVYYIRRIVVQELTFRPSQYRRLVDSITYCSTTYRRYGCNSVLYYALV